MLRVVTRVRRIVAFAGALLFGFATAAAAIGVAGGKKVLIQAAPWSVVVRQDGYMICTGVIISATRVLTAGHCIYEGGKGAPDPASTFTVTAGLSNFNEPAKDGIAQVRRVSSVRVMEGYIPTSRWSELNEDQVVAHDLAVLTLSRPLNLNGPDARAALLPAAGAPEPSSTTEVFQAGYGQQSLTKPPTGALTEVVGLRVHAGCTTRGALCVWSTTSSTCLGDSGAGLVEQGSASIVFGIVSTGNAYKECAPADLEALAPSSDYPEGYIFLGADVYLGSPAALQFIDHA